MDEWTSIKAPSTVAQHEASHLCCMCMPYIASTLPESPQRSWWVLVLAKTRPAHRVTRKITSTCRPSSCLGSCGSLIHVVSCFTGCYQYWSVVIMDMVNCTQNMLNKNSCWETYFHKPTKQTEHVPQTNLSHQPCTLQYVWTYCTVQIALYFHTGSGIRGK